MITVAGFNTAVDRTVQLDVLKVGAVQRARSAMARPGGKGLHVAQTIAALGEQVCLVGLDDAVHATLFANHLRARGVEWRAVRIDGDLRQCLAVHEADGRVTELLEPSGRVDPGARHALLNAVVEFIARSDALVLSGSLPDGFPTDTYATLVKRAAQLGLPCLVDTSGEALRVAIQSEPWLVKPNADECSALLRKPVTDVATAAECVNYLRAEGVHWPVVTLGADGALAFDGHATWHAWSDAVEHRNSVGSGDCFVAAMAVAIVRKRPVKEALRCAVAAGAANAGAEESGFADIAHVRALLPLVHLQLAHVQPRSAAG